MANNLNDTQSAPDTGNPQGVGTSNGASNAGDFQQTASQETLQDQNQSLQVEDVTVASQTPANSAGLSPFWWALIAFAVVFAISYLAIKLFDTEEPAPARAAARPTPATTKKKSVANKSAKKTTAKKKPAARKSAKRSSRKRR